MRLPGNENDLLCLTKSQPAAAIGGQRGKGNPWGERVEWGAVAKEPKWSTDRRGTTQTAAKKSTQNDVVDSDSDSDVDAEEMQAVRKCSTVQRANGGGRWKRRH